jgi:hypothetical protein
MSDISKSAAAELESALIDLRAKSASFAEQDAITRCLDLIHEARMRTRRDALRRKAKKLGMP